MFKLTGITFKRLYLCQRFILFVKKRVLTYSDEELLRLYRESMEPEYLVELYRRYTVLVYGVALKYLKNIPEAEDAVMLIWEGLFDKVLNHDIQVFKPWLYTCVRNYCLMELRKKSANISVKLDEKFMEFCDDFHPIDETEEHDETLKECLKALPEKQQLCISYFYMEERSYKEIEQISGLTLKLIKSCIQNGRRNLRLCLEKKGMRK